MFSPRRFPDPSNHAPKADSGCAEALEKDQSLAEFTPALGERELVRPTLIGFAPILRCDVGLRGMVRRVWGPSWGTPQVVQAHCICWSPMNLDSSTLTPPSGEIFAAVLNRWSGRGPRLDEICFRWRVRS